MQAQFYKYSSISQLKIYNVLWTLGKFSIPLKVLNISKQLITAAKEETRQALQADKYRTSWMSIAQWSRNLGWHLYMIL